MQIQDFSIWEPLLGGVLIGLASAALMYFNGKIAGISGIFRGLLVPQGAIAWRAMFIGGMVLAGLVIVLVSPQMFVNTPERGMVTTLLAGLLVGIGVRIGSGCTSGHGICGIGRLSLRSMASVGVFMAAGIGMVWITNHLLGGVL
jgi:uncharacterized membrane protein YedE/YeeE